jgi:type VI secretion system protein ImpB
MQHKLDRVRRPRVHITYDVETGGALKKTELPFVVGVLADLSGQPKQALPPLRDRKAVYIDRDNFNDVLARSNARLAMKVPNMLTDPNSKIAVELNFKHIDDFEPARVAEQIAPLKQLLDMRQELTQLLSRLEGNDKLDELLADVLANTDKAKALGQFMDKQSHVEAPAAPKPMSAAPVPPKPAPPPPAGTAAAPKPAPPAPPRPGVPAAGAAPAPKPPVPGSVPPKPAPPTGAAPAPKPAMPPAPPANVPPKPPAPVAGATPPPAPKPPAPPAPPAPAASAPAPTPPAPPAPPAPPEAGGGEPGVE